MSTHHPDAYTYMAAIHCPACAERAFGRNERGFIAEDAMDGEGNPVGVIFSWDWDRDDESREHGEHCDTCGAEILAPDNCFTRAAALGITIDTEPYSSLSVWEDGALRLTMRDPRPDPQRPGGFRWTLTAYDGASPANVVATDDTFCPSPMLRPMESEVDAGRVVVDALMLFAHCLTHNGYGERIPSDIPGGDDWADWADMTAQSIEH